MNAALIIAITLFAIVFFMLAMFGCLYMYEHKDVELTGLLAGMLTVLFFIALISYEISLGTVTYY